MIRLVVFGVLAGLSSALVDVTPLVEEWKLDKTVNAYTLVTWSTLIRDGEQMIIVDLPPMNETVLQTKMNDALKERKMTPALIHNLVLTHGHSKNFGFNSEFPNARQFFSTYEHNGKTFLRTGLYENGKMQLSPNVQLWYTPGNAPEDISVIVSNVPKRGTVAIAGNLIFNSNDILDPSFWEENAQHLHAGIKRRRKVICHADYVIPGHGPIFAVTEQHRDAVKCHQKPQADEPTEDGGNEEQQRRRRQHEQDQSQQQALDHQRYDQLRRQNQLDYQQKVEQWKRDQEERRRLQGQTDPQSGQEPARASGDNVDCCAQQPCANNQPLCNTDCCVQQPCLENQPLCRTDCCVQQPCPVNQPVCSTTCCTQPPCQQNQPPCQQNQPPCQTSSSCNQQQQSSCSGNQVQCQTGCQQRQDCRPAPAQPVPVQPVRCEQTETHHHYIGAEQEIFHTHIRKEQNDLTTTLNDQQKQIRADQDKVNHILLEHVGDISRAIREQLERDRRFQNEWQTVVARQKQEKANLEDTHARELAELNNRQRPIDVDVRQDNALRALEEHKRTVDQWWIHQKNVEETKKAQEEVTYKKTVKPAYNFTSTVQHKPCPNVPSQPIPTVQAQPCASSCNSGCATGCSSSCNTGCAQGCNTGCAQSPCADPVQPHRHRPGQRHIGGRIRWRRHQAGEKRRQRKLEQPQEPQTPEEAREQ